jgi:cytochrome c553
MADVAVLPRRPRSSHGLEERRPATRRPKASEVCLACHGTNGVGITATIPTIAGQHQDYIERALTDYQKGGRKNPVMAGMAANLTREDIEALATFYAGQKPALKVVPRRVSFLSSN